MFASKLNQKEHALGLVSSVLLQVYAPIVINCSFSHWFCLPAATDPKEADIIWVSMQVDSEVKNALGLTDQQYTNQFPFEACLVMKHHLAETIHKVSS